MLTIIYFVVTSGTIFSLLYAKKAIGGVTLTPFSIFDEFYESGIGQIPLSFTRTLNGTNVHAHTIPPDTLFTMTVFLEGVNGSITDFFPSSFEVVDAGTGNITMYNTVYDQITFQSSPAVYTLRSTSEGVFYFGKAQLGTYEEYETYKVHVTSTGGWFPMFALDSLNQEITDVLTHSDNNSTYLYEGGYIDIFQWAGEVPPGAVVTGSTVYIELDEASGELDIGGTHLIPTSPDLYSVPTNTTDSIRITQYQGSSSIDQVYLNVTYLSEPTIEISSGVTPTKAEIGDLILLNALLQNTGESPANNTIFQVQDEIYPCGDIPPSCSPSLSFNLESSPIPLTAVWHAGSTTKDQYISLFTMEDHLSSTVPDIVAPGELFEYDLEINNDWDPMQDVVVRINSPFQSYCTYSQSFGEDYCFVQNLHKGKNRIGFAVIPDETSPDGEFQLSVNLTYTNPNGNRHDLNDVEQKTVNIQGNYITSISRELTKISGGAMRVTPHKVPPSTVFNMTLILEGSGQVNDTLTEYFPTDFAIINLGGGNAVGYNATHTRITWDITAPTNISYTLRSPTDWPATYYFGPASFAGFSEPRPYRVTVADPTETYATVNAGSNAVDSGLTLSDNNALNDYDDTFANAGNKWNTEYWYFVMDDVASMPSDYLLQWVLLTMHHWTSGYTDDDFNVECNLADDSNPDNDWTDLELYVDTSNEPPTAKTNSTWNLTSLCNLDTWTELNQLRIAIRGTGTSKGEDTVTWYVDYLNATVFYVAYPDAEITQFRVYNSTSTTIGTGNEICDITTPEDSSEDTCSGLEADTSYRVEIKVKNNGADSLQISEINHTLMDSLVDTLGTCGYSGASSNTLDCGLVGTNVTINDEGNTPPSHSEDEEYWYYYLFIAKSSISNLADSYIKVYDNAARSPWTNTTSDNLNMNVVGDPDTITVDLYSDAAYTTELKTFDVGDTVYIQAHVKDADSNNINTGTTAVNLTFDDGYNNDYEGYDSYFTLTQSGDFDGKWEGSWDSTGKGDALYLPVVNNSNKNSILGNSTFHIYSGSGISAYGMDYDDDLTDDYVLESKHLVAIFNGTTDAERYLSFLYQKDTDVSYTFYDINDADFVGQGTPVSSDSGSSSMEAIAFNATEADSLEIVQLDIENALGVLEVDIIVGGVTGGGVPVVGTFLNESSKLNNYFNITNVISTVIGEVEIVDIDNDLKNEVLVGSGSASQVPYLQIYENQSGTMEPIANLTHPDDDDNQGYVRSIAVGDIDNDGSTTDEIVTCCDSQEGAAIWKKAAGGYWEAIFNISLASQCDAVAVGDIDNDNDIEFVISRWTTGVCDVYLYENTSSSWSVADTYNNFQSCGFQIHYMEVGDADGDSNNELLVAYGNEPMQILEYTDGGSMVSVINLSHDPANPWTFAFGDVTNDGKVDIVMVESFLDEIVIFEDTAQDGSWTNTKNVTATSHQSSGYTGLQIGDFDLDGDNEYVLGSGGATDNEIWIFRDDTLLYKEEVGFEVIDSISVGDFDNSAPSASSFLNVSMQSEDADYLLFNLSAWSDTVIESVYFPIGGSIGSTVEDDVMYIGNGTEDNTTNFGAVGMPNDILVGMKVTGTEANVTMAWENISNGWVNTLNITIADDALSVAKIVIEDIDTDGDEEILMGGINFLSTPLYEKYPAKTMIFENQSGGHSLTEELPGPEPSDSAEVLDLEVGDLDNDGDDDLEILACYGPRGPKTVEIWDDKGSGYISVFNITNVLHDDGGCEDVEIGDIDDDGKNEFVITEEHLSPYAAIIRVYENVSDLWENTANYSFPGTPQDFHFYGMYISDIDNEGPDNVVVYQGWNCPLIFEYSGTSLDLIYNLTHTEDCGLMNSGNAQRSFLVGDVNNDNKDEIVLPDFTTNVLMVFENTSSDIINTVNVSVDLGASQPDTDARNSWAIGDIDNDGDNEYIYTGSVQKKLFIFRSNTLLSSYDLPTSLSIAAAIGDFNNANNYGSLAWADLPGLTPAQSFITVYDNQTFDSENDNQIVWIEALNSSTTLLIDTFSVWGQSENEAAGIRIKYDTDSANAVDYAEFILAFTQGDYNDISDNMADVSTGSYPTSFYSFTAGPCPVIDGEGDSCANEWTAVDYWLIDDPDSDAGGDTTDITEVYTRDDDTDLFVRVDVASGTPSTTMWINFSDDGTNYRCYAKTDGTSMTLCEVSDNCASPAQTCATGCFDNDGDGTDVAEWKISISDLCDDGKCDVGGLCTGTSGSVYVKVTTDDDLAADAAWTEHDFSTDGPQSPIPELPFGAIIALLLPLIMLMFMRRNRI
jgi:hypothetical protein